MTCESHITNVYTRAITQDPLLLQATFLRGTSALASKKAESPALAAELEQLDDDRLDTRCRRNGLSKKGGRDMQVLSFANNKRRGTEQEEATCTPFGLK